MNIDDPKAPWYTEEACEICGGHFSVHRCGSVEMCLDCCMDEDWDDGQPETDDSASRSR